jgi:hypothetical protein
MTTTNKLLLISESRGDSNWCTPYREKPDQHATYTSQVSPRTPDVCFIRAIPVHGNLSWVIDRVEQTHYFWEKGSRYNPQCADWPIHRSVPNFSLEPTNEVAGAKPTIYRWPATRLAGPISPACDRYIQYLLTGANPSVLNQHGRELQPWRCQLFTYNSLTFPTSYLPFPPKGPAQSLV